MKKLFLVFILLLSLLLPACSCELIEVEATVIKTEYIASFSTTSHQYDFLLERWVLKTEYHPEQYNVSVSYDGTSSTFDSREFYEQYKKGDKIKMFLNITYNRKGKEIWRSLDLQKY